MKTVHQNRTNKSAWPYKKYHQEVESTSEVARLHKILVKDAVTFKKSDLEVLVGKPYYYFSRHISQNLIYRTQRGD